MRHFQLTLIALLIVILAVVPLAGCVPASEEEDWKSKYETLQLENTILKADLQTAQADITYLQSASEKLRNDYDSLKAEYDTLKTDNAILQNTSKKLQSEYDALLANYNALQADYDALITLPAAPTPTPSLTSDTEEVLLYKVLNLDSILIIRQNGESWLLENGIGCLSLELKEGWNVLIYSPGLFAGIGSKLLIPDYNQQCIIWNSEFVGEKQDIIETKIDGAFEGWSGDTVFQLRNGQIWQQASYNYTYHYAYSPDVFIFNTTNGYKMMVDGVSSSIYVRRLN